MSQGELADALGCQRSSISNYEIGRRQPSIQHLQQLAKTLGVSLEYFGVPSNEINDLIARARIVFENKQVPTCEKERVYKEIMRLYLQMEDQ